MSGDSRNGFRDSDEVSETPEMVSETLTGCPETPEMVSEILMKHPDTLKSIRFVVFNDVPRAANRSPSSRD